MQNATHMAKDKLHHHQSVSQSVYFLNAELTKRNHT